MTDGLIILTPLDLAFAACLMLLLTALSWRLHLGIGRQGQMGAQGFDLGVADQDITNAARLSGAVNDQPVLQQSYGLSDDRQKARHAVDHERRSCRVRLCFCLFLEGP